MKESYSQYGQDIILNDRIFKQKTLHEELMEGFKKEQEDLKDEEEQ